MALKAPLSRVISDNTRPFEEGFIGKVISDAQAASVILDVGEIFAVPLDTVDYQRYVALTGDVPDVLIENLKDQAELVGLRFEAISYHVTHTVECHFQVHGNP